MKTKVRMKAGILRAVIRQWKGTDIHLCVLPEVAVNKPHQRLCIEVDSPNPRAPLGFVDYQHWLSQSHLCVAPGTMQAKRYEALLLTRGWQVVVTNKRYRQVEPLYTM